MKRVKNTSILIAILSVPAFVNIYSQNITTEQLMLADRQNETVTGISFLKDDPAGRQIPELLEKDFQISFFFPPFSTNWIHNSRTVNKVSLNLMIGNAGGVDGVELGGFLNTINHNVKGFQGAGFGNVVRGSLDGAQLAGFFNISGSDATGLQGAGFFNVAGGSIIGAQGAGFINVSGGSLKGFQGAGFGNISGGTTRGAQVSGFLNVAAEYQRGAQLAGFLSVSGGGTSNAQLSGFANFSRDIRGAQMAGFANIARNVTGVQMAGFLNVCDSIDGVPIGFINVVKKNGYRHFDVSISETQYFNFSYRMGVRHFHNIYSVGKPSGPGNRWLFGFGIGGETDVREDMTLTLEALVNQEFWIADSKTGRLFHIDRLNLLNQFRALFAYHPNKRVALFLGPTFNVSVAETNPDLGYFAWNPIGPNRAVLNQTYGNTAQTNVRLWIGITGGIRL